MGEAKGWPGPAVRAETEGPALAKGECKIAFEFPSICMHGCIVIMREPAGPDRLLHHHEAPPAAVVAQVPSVVE